MVKLSKYVDLVLDRIIQSTQAQAGIDYWTCENGRWLYCRTGQACVDEVRANPPQQRAKMTRYTLQGTEPVKH